MKKSILFLAATMAVLFLVSCGGGGGNPTLPAGNRDLSGLEGNWIINWSYSGTINTPEGPYQMADSGVGTWVITTNTVYNGADFLSWSYDGSTLVVQNNISVSDYDYDCGNLTITIGGQFKIDIKPSSTYGNLKGTANVLMYTDWCGDASGKIDYTGNLTR